MMGDPHHHGDPATDARTYNFTAYLSTDDHLDVYAFDKSAVDPTDGTPVNLTADERSAYLAALVRAIEREHPGIVSDIYYEAVNAALPLGDTE